MQQKSLPKHKADISVFSQGANAELVTEVLEAVRPSFFLARASHYSAIALSKALSIHPKDSFSKPKEKKFFLNNRSEALLDENCREYLESFHPSFRRDTQAIGNGSVSYLGYSDAICQALAFDERANFITSV